MSQYDEEYEEKDEIDDNEENDEIDEIDDYDDYYGEYENLFTEQEAFDLESFSNQTALCQTDPAKVNQTAHDCFNTVLDSGPDQIVNFTDDELVQYCRKEMDPFLFKAFRCFNPCSDYECKVEGFYYAELMYRSTFADDLPCPITVKGVCTRSAEPNLALILFMTFLTLALMAIGSVLLWKVKMKANSEKNNKEVNVVSI